MLRTIWTLVFMAIISSSTNPVAAQDENPKLGLELYIIFSKLTGTRDELLAVLQEHLDYQYKIEAEGAMFAAGPVVSETDDGPSGNGVIVIRADSFAAAREIADADPFHSKGIKTYDIQRWTVNEGSMRLDIRFSSGAVDIE